MPEDYRKYTPEEIAASMLPDRDQRTLLLVRELGFDSAMGIVDGQSIFGEKVFFLGPCRCLKDAREEGAHATEDAIKEFIAYWENQISVAKDYLANGRNNKTHEWAK